MPFRWSWLCFAVFLIVLFEFIQLFVQFLSHFLPFSPCFWMISLIFASPLFLFVVILQYADRVQKAWRQKLSKIRGTSELVAPVPATSAAAQSSGAIRDSKSKPIASPVPVSVAAPPVRLKPKASIKPILTAAYDFVVSLDTLKLFMNKVSGLQPISGATARPHRRFSFLFLSTFPLFPVRWQTILLQITQKLYRSRCGSSKFRRKSITKNMPLSRTLIKTSNWFSIIVSLTTMRTAILARWVALLFILRTHVALIAVIRLGSAVVCDQIEKEMGKSLRITAKTISWIRWHSRCCPSCFNSFSSSNPCGCNS